MKKKIKKEYVIGVDGGGTKTIAALANLEGKILKIGKAGSSNLRNLGIKKSVENLVKAISQVLNSGKILSTFIGLPAIAEEYKLRKKEIKRELKKHKKISKIFEGKVIINSDQKVAFRAGTDGDGVILISGTGCVAKGWKGKRRAHSSGWGYLADEGGAFFVGQKVFQAILKDLDGRGQKTLLTNLVFKMLKIKKEENFLIFVYKDPIKTISLLSIFCDKASQKGDRVAKEIMIKAATEAALTAKAVIKKLKFQKIEFPLVLSGSLFKSKIFKEKVKKEIKKFAPKVKFILLKKEPVIGAIKLAIEEIKNDYF